MTIRKTIKTTHVAAALALAAGLGLSVAPALAGSDFNNDGFEDLAIGVPNESVDSTAGAGIVQVFYGTAAGTSVTSPADQVWSQNSAGIANGCEANEAFGAVLATGDFNHDGYDDLAIGVPDESIVVNGVNKFRAGCVHVIYGSHLGLSNVDDEFWVQGFDGLKGAAEPNDRFGSALAAGDFDDDGFDDLAVGIPGQGVNNRSLAGAVHVLYGFPTGLISQRNTIITQDSANILETAEISDNFGAALAAADFGDDGSCDLAVGVPGEGLLINNTQVFRAGVVQVIYGGGNGLSTVDQVWRQGAGSIPGNAQASDEFGTTLAAASLATNFGTRSFLVVGVPFDDDAPVGSGSVVVLEGNNIAHRLTGANSKLINFDIVNSPGPIAPGARFGQAIALADFGRNTHLFALTLDLAIGAPGASFVDANGVPTDGCGAVFVIYDIASDIDPAQVQILVQGQGPVLDAPETGDGFGASLAASNFGFGFNADLAIGVPDESTNLSNVGAVHILFGKSNGVLGSAGSQFFTQNSPNVDDQAETFDHFGFALGAGGGVR